MTLPLFGALDTVDPYPMRVRIIIERARILSPAIWQLIVYSIIHVFDSDHRIAIMKNKMAKCWYQRGKFLSFQYVIEFDIESSYPPLESPSFPHESLRQHMINLWLPRFWIKVFDPSEEETEQ